MIYLETERLILREWRAQDIEPFCELSADAQVMKYFPATATFEESCLMIERFQQLALEHGYAFQPAIDKNTGEFVGLMGLSVVSTSLPFAPAVEIGWRLSPEYWGKGLASEAANALLKYGFETLGLADIYAYTPALNEPSWAVMERIGMERVGDGDFDHPKIPAKSDLRRCVLYRKIASQP